jgi:hypothetical protein
MKTISTIFAAALTLVLQAGFAGAHANATSAQCTGPTVTDYVSSNGKTDTLSTTFINVTDAHLNFTTSSTGCVVITFTAVGFVEPGTGNNTAFDIMSLRTLLDGNNLCMPGLYDELFLSLPSPGGASVNSVTHICKNVAAGAHTVQVEIETNGNVGVIRSPVLTVTHN